jgi:hypothetical protein
MANTNTPVGRRRETTTPQRSNDRWYFWSKPVVGPQDYDFKNLQSMVYGNGWRSFVI